MTDLCKYYKDPVCESPLDVDSDKVGTLSDHFMVIMEPIDAFNNRKERKENSFLYRSYTDAAFDKMDNMLDNINWSEILDDDLIQNKMEIFHHKLYKIYDTCFPQKRKTVFSENQPFFTDKLAKLKRKKCREYNKNRKSEKYNSLARIYNKELNNAKKKFYRKKVCSLRSSNAKKWFRNIKNLINQDDGKELLQVDDIKDLPDELQAEKIADSFAEVSREYEPLDRSKVKFPEFTKSDIPKFSTFCLLTVFL